MEITEKIAAKLLIRYKVRNKERKKGRKWYSKNIRIIVSQNREFLHLCNEQGERGIWNGNV